MNTPISRSPVTDMQTSGKSIAMTHLRQGLGFRNCEPDVIDALVTAGHVRQLGKGEFLVRRGEPFDALCLVIEGSLEASVTYADGRHHLFAYLNAGDIGGIMSLLDGMPHTNDLCARDNLTRVLLVSGSQFRVLRDRFATIARAMELQLAYRARLLHERTMGDHNMPLDVRLARMLHVFAALGGRRQPGGMVVMKMTQADIGNLLGVSRQRANFAAQQLKQDNLIAINYSELTIIDVDGLARHAGL